MYHVKYGRDDICQSERTQRTKESEPEPKYIGQDHDLPALSDTLIFNIELFDPMPTDKFHDSSNQIIFDVEDQKKLDLIPEKHPDAAENKNTVISSSPSLTADIQTGGIDFTDKLIAQGLAELFTPSQTVQEAPAENHIAEAPDQKNNSTFEQQTLWVDSNVGLVAEVATIPKKRGPGRPRKTCNVEPQKNNQKKRLRVIAPKPSVIKYLLPNPVPVESQASRLVQNPACERDINLHLQPFVASELKLKTVRINAKDREYVAEDKKDQKYREYREANSAASRRSRMAHLQMENRKTVRLAYLEDATILMRAKIQELSEENCILKQLLMNKDCVDQKKETNSNYLHRNSSFVTKDSAE